MLSNNLREARKRLGLSQWQVADKAGIARSSYTGYESGKHKPSMEAVASIARVLGTSPNTLWGLDEMSTESSLRESVAVYGPSIEELQASLMESERAYKLLCDSIGDTLQEIVKLLKERKI